MKKLHISLIFSKLVVTKPLITIITLMHNFIVKFGKILDIFKEFAGNRVNDLGNVPQDVAHDTSLITIFGRGTRFGVHADWLAGPRLTRPGCARLANPGFPRCSHLRG